MGIYGEISGNSEDPPLVHRAGIDSYLPIAVIHVSFIKCYCLG